MLHYINVLCIYSMNIYALVLLKCEAVPLKKGYLHDRKSRAKVVRISASDVISEIADVVITDP